MANALISFNLFLLYQWRNDVTGHGERKRQRSKLHGSWWREAGAWKGDSPAHRGGLLLAVVNAEVPLRAPVNWCCNHPILRPAWTCRIFDQRTLPNLFFPLLLLIDRSTKAWERLTCQTKALWVPWKSRLGGGWKESKWPYYFHLH